MEFDLISVCMYVEKPSLPNLQKLAFVCAFETNFGFEMFHWVPVTVFVSWKGTFSVLKE